MREAIGTFDAVPRTIEGLSAGGVLLVSGREGNPMTIGWASAGRIWGRPVLIVLVRPSRYSFGLLEAHGEFTVNLPDADLRRAVAICGSKSGRDVDKIKECGLTLGKSRNIEVPHIVQCPVHYECRVIHKSNVVNADLAADIVASSYPQGDFHRVYYGEILGVFEEKK